MESMTPCPYCGSRPDVMMTPLVITVNGQRYIGGQRYQPIIRCPVKCPGYGGHVLLTATQYKTQGEVIRVWEDAVRADMDRIRKEHAHGE